MSFYATLLEQVIFPLVGRTTNRKFFLRYQDVLKSQSLSCQELDDLQLVKLHRLVQHAYDHVPYYRALFKKAKLKPVDIHTVADLKKLPITTKADLRQAGLAKTTADNKDEILTYLDSTSGSTGEPFQFIGDVAARDLSTAYTLRSWSWGGYHLGDRYVSLWGYHKADTSNKLYNWLMRNSYIWAFKLDGHFHQDVELLRRVKPTLMTAYTSSAVKFAKMLRKNNVTDITVPAIVTTSENLYPNDRQVIEKALHGKVYDRYGSRELGAVAGECQEQNGLHINAESYIVEYAAPPRNYSGQAKKLIVTHLDKFGMPLIRYDTGDMATPGDDSPCRCGLSLPKIGSIDGRVTDFLKLKDGSFVPYLFFNYSLEQYGPLIKQFQISQPNLEELILKLLPAGKFSAEKQRELAGKLEEGMRYLTKVKIEIVKDIPLSRAGKFVIVDQKVPLD